MSTRRVLFFFILFVAAAALAQPYVAQNGLTPAEFQISFNQLSRQGYRLKSISGYVSGGERYAALWVKENGPEWMARNGLQAVDMLHQIDLLNHQGFHLVWISAHQGPGGVTFEGIWEKRPGPPPEVMLPLDEAALQPAISQHRQQGMRVTHISGYSSGSVARYAVIFDHSSGPEWQVRHNLDAQQFQQAFNQLAGQGFRAVEISGYNVGGSDRFAGLWQRAGGAWWARSGVPDAWYQNVFDNMRYSGGTPLYVSAYTSGNAGRLNLIWQNTSFSANDLSFIATQMQNYLNAQHAPGAAIAITKDGRLVYASGFGYADQETGEEAGPNSLFRIASVSKPFTSVAIMKLIEAGRLRLTDHVFGPGGILGSEYPTPAGNQKINQITIKYLLEHVSGLSNNNGDPMFMNTGMNHHQLITWMLNDPAHRMTRDTNTQFEYLNFGFCLLGRVIEKITGQPYEQFVRQAVLGPSGITDMTIGANSEAARKPHEVKYYPADAYTLNVTRFDSHGGWIASPIDLARFIVHVDGLPTKPDIVSAQLHTLMTTDSGIKDDKGNDPNYAFGWGVSPQWHNGAMEGTVSYLAVLPNGYTFAAVVNTRPANDTFAGNLSNTIQRIIKGVSAWPGYDLF
jgi:CubicO group peptidase (beta-lactamase class C family)